MNHIIAPEIEPAAQSRGHFFGARHFSVTAVQDGGQQKDERSRDFRAVTRLRQKPAGIKAQKGHAGGDLVRRNSGAQQPTADLSGNFAIKMLGEKAVRVFGEFVHRMREFYYVVGLSSAGGKSPAESRNPFPQPEHPDWGKGLW